MKAFRSWWPVLPATAIILGSCQKKEEPTAPAAPGEVATTPAKVEAAPAPAVKALTPGERAAMLGIVGQLSKETESVMALYDGKEIVSRLKGLKTWAFIREVSKEVDGTDPEEEIAANAEEAGKFLGQEIFIATGKGTVPQVENLTKVGRRMNYYQMKAMTHSFNEAAKSGDLSTAGEPDEAYLMEMAKELGKDMPLIDSLALPPMLIGIKAADAETLGKAQEQLGSSIEMMFGMLGEGAKPVDFTKGGVAFKGYKLEGSFVAEQLEQARADIEQMLEPGDVDHLIGAIKKKNVVVAHGSKDDYLMLYTGDSEEGCPLAESVDESLAANEAISYVDAYKDKKLVGFLYGDKGIAKSMLTGSLKDMAQGIRDGLAGTDVYGETRELAALLDMVGEKEDAVVALAKPDTIGGLIVLEDGVKFELFGGNDYGAIDHAADHKLANLGSKDGVLVFSNWVSNKEYSKRAGEYGEVLVETAYALAEKVAGLNIENEDFAQFKQGFGLFNEKFRADALGAWEALSTAESGLGTEAAFVVDLNGTVPQFPGIPQEVADSGKFFRATMVSPVTDRAKLGESWTKLEGSLRNIFKTVSEMTGEEIPMQKPMTSEKNDIASYFFALPFTNDDFIPSVTVSDKWFAASTSKLQALDLVTSADSAAGDRKGAWVEFDFDTLRKFTAEWVTLLEKHGEAMVGGPEKFEEFKAQLPRIQKGLAAIEEFDSVSASERVEGGKLRSTLHFKVR
ncbi:hypothetical protein [Luteolibacter luteus]|uniref:Uncharacterized protein n=1 Tax=Luteolibacter luteus TaxID=2728835 RepID=A0A858RC54_9BACT|nr:hypothetical protein [Luteolibacter luteus]QJE94221.1 hypothetical protein HHL09_02965 [Luteolibacter luteus]